MAGAHGALARWVDDKGYLFHKDNETWMDARRNPDLAAYSPRSTRANDIQALWHEQLLASAEFAATMGDVDAQQRWTQAAARVRANFARDFVDGASALIADHLAADDKPNFTLRPNALFTLELVADDALAARVTRRAWQTLVYPWGVSTLDQNDPFFHPYHLAAGAYHKDEAYHNGTVWPWLNGIAMQRMIEFGQVELAWPLFQYTDELALSRGVVGGLAETMDAYPHPGERSRASPAPSCRRGRTPSSYGSGTSMSSACGPTWRRARSCWLHVCLRAWAPWSSPSGRGLARCPQASTASMAIGATSIAWPSNAAKLVLDISPFEIGSFDGSPGDTVIAEVTSAGVRVRVQSDRDAVKSDVLLPPSPARQSRQAGLDAVLAGTAFAAPKPLESHKVMQPFGAGAHPSD